MDWIVPVAIAFAAAAIALLASWYDTRRTRSMTPDEIAQDRLDQQTW
jgi:hypothetical protein